MEICCKQRHFTNISPCQRTTVLVFTQNKHAPTHLPQCYNNFYAISFMFSTDEKKRLSQFYVFCYYSCKNFLLNDNNNIKKNFDFENITVHCTLGTNTVRNTAKVTHSSIERRGFHTISSFLLSCWRFCEGFVCFCSHTPEFAPICCGISHSVWSWAEFGSESPPEVHPHCGSRRLTSR